MKQGTVAIACLFLCLSSMTTRAANEPAALDTTAPAPEGALTVTQTPPLFSATPSATTTAPIPVPASSPTVAAPASTTTPVTAPAAAPAPAPATTLLPGNQTASNNVKTLKQADVNRMPSRERTAIQADQDADLSP